MGSSPGATVSTPAVTASALLDCRDVFNLQGSELIIILLLALVVLGPEKLPDAMRKLGQVYAELKKMSSGFQQEFRAVVDEPMREVRDTANVLRDSADFTKLQQGERNEKPKSADMAPADPAAVVSDDLPFQMESDSAAASLPPMSSDAASGNSPAPVDGDGDQPRPQPFSSQQVSSASPRTPPPAASSSPPTADPVSDPVPDAGSDPVPDAGSDPQVSSAPPPPPPPPPPPVLEQPDAQRLAAGARPSGRRR